MSNTMKPFMDPRSVALIGISRATGPDAHNILENLMNAGYSGRIYPVNPKADEILGLRAYASVLDIADDIDLAVLSVSRSEVLRTVMECTQMGIRAITIISEGFADANDEGREMQSEVVRIAREGGARILGPNTWGTANAFNNFSTGFTPMILGKIPSGFIAQTGFYFGLTDVAGKGIDLGNTGDIDFVDGLEYFEDDPDIKVIFLHIEGIRDGRRFMEVAARVARKKPILAVKTGRVEAAARATQSHSGSLAGSDEVYDAAFRQSGIIRVADLDQFEDLAKAFLRLPLMRGKGVAFITPSGGAGIMAIDLTQKHDLHLAQFSLETLGRVNALAPVWQRVDNPVDIWAASAFGKYPLREVFPTVLDSLLQDEDVHAVMLLFPGYVAHTEEKKLLEIVERGSDKPIVCWPGTAGVEQRVGVEQRRAALEKTGKVVFFPTMERALRALSSLHTRWRYVSTTGESV